MEKVEGMEDAVGRANGCERDMVVSSCLTQVRRFSYRPGRSVDRRELNTYYKIIRLGETILIHCSTGSTDLVFARKKKMII